MFRYKNKTKQNTLILVAGLFLSSCLGVTRVAGASTPSATFYVSPSTSSVSSGTTLSIDLRINVTNDSTHSARARITYSPDKMELANATPTPPFFEAEETSGSGVVSLAYGSLSGVSGDRSFATITFKIIADSGNASVIIDPVIDANYHSYVAGDSSSTGANILNSIKNGLYTITRTNDSSQTSPTVSEQLSQNQSTQSGAETQDKTSQSNTSTNKTTSDNKYTGVGTNLTGGSSTSGTNNPKDSTAKVLVVLAFVLLVLISQLITRRRKIRKTKSIHPVTRRETVADIAARIKSKDHSKQTVAEVAARLKLDKKHHPHQTITELAPKLSHKNMNKKRKRPSATSGKR